MGQVTIYLDGETEQKLNGLIADKNISKSKWIADLIRQKTQTEWPDRIKRLAGTWRDMPTADEIRQSEGSDTVREPL